MPRALTDIIGVRIYICVLMGEIKLSFTVSVILTRNCSLGNRVAFFFARQ